MSKRASIISTFIRDISSETTSRGYRGFRYLHEINDFPCFCFHPEVEQRIWTDGPYGIVRGSLRGYVHSDNIDDVEIYARDIERAIQSISQRYRDLINDCRVITVRTDEGVMAPYFIVDMSVEILYSVKITDTIRVDTTRLTADLTSITADKGI